MKVYNRSLAFNIKEPDTSFKVPLVTKLHPAIPNISKMIDQYYPIIKNCPLSTFIFPRDSIFSAYRKLPSLSSILASNPFSVPSIPTSPKGFHPTPGCSCKEIAEDVQPGFTLHQTSPGHDGGWRQAVHHQRCQEPPLPHFP